MKLGWLFFISLLTTLGLPAQDTSYAKRIDSFYMHYTGKVVKKKYKLDKVSVDVGFYKSTKHIRYITVWHDTSLPKIIIFFFEDDNIVMASPVGQQPYFIKDREVVVAAQPKHTKGEIKRFLQKGHAYKEFALSKYH